VENPLTHKKALEEHIERRNESSPKFRRKRANTINAKTLVNFDSLDNYAQRIQRNQATPSFTQQIM